MDAQIESYKKKIEEERNKIQKIKAEIKIFKERKDNEISICHKHIDDYKTKIDKLKSTK